MKSCMKLDVLNQDLNVYTLAENNISVELWIIFLLKRIVVLTYNYPFSIFLHFLLSSNIEFPLSRDVLQEGGKKNQLSHCEYNWFNK